MEGKGLELTGIGVRRERFHIYKMSHIVPMSNQTPFAPQQRCEGECWRLKTSCLGPYFERGLSMSETQDTLMVCVT